MLFNRSSQANSFIPRDTWQFKFNTFFWNIFDGSLAANIYLFKVNNRNPRKSCEMCSNLTVKTPKRCLCWSLFLKRGFNTWHRCGVFIVSFEHIYTFF